MQFVGVDNPYGTAPAFQTVVWPMPELQNKKLVRKARRSLRTVRAPRPPSHILRDFLLS
jgi:hypothetical protein